MSKEAAKRALLGRSILTIESGRVSGRAQSPMVHGTGEWEDLIDVGQKDDTLTGDRTIEGTLGMTEFGKLLVLLGVMLAVTGVVLMLLGRTHLPGRLPGDFVYRGKHTTVYFPLATSILLSVVLSLVLYAIGRWRR
jgi:hypothetical protein